MSGPRREYVIDPVKPKPRVDLKLPPMQGTGEGASGADAASETAAGNRRRAQGYSAIERRSGWPLLLLYCVGPFAMLATSRGRRNRVWVAAAFMSVIVGCIAAYLWDPIVSGTVGGSRSALILLVSLCAALLAGFAAWARGIHLIGRQEGARVRRIPDLLKRPAGAGLLGAVMPGLGLMISGRSRQAAAALWMVCVTLVSALVLSQADWLWRFDRRAGALAAGGRALEYFFVFMAACAVLGAVAWISQAIDGMRLAAKGNGRIAARRAKLAIAAVCAVLAAWTLVFERGALAGRLDSAAAALHEEGFEIVPLVMAGAAMRLDSSRPEYAAHAIALYESAGKIDQALVLRRSLVERLAPCIEVLEEEGLVMRAATDPKAVPARVDGEAIPAELPLPAQMLIGPQAQMPFGP